MQADRSLRRLKRNVNVLLETFLPLAIYIRAQADARQRVKGRAFFSRGHSRRPAPRERRRPCIPFYRKQCTRPIAHSHLRKFHSYAVPPGSPVSPPLSRRLAITQASGGFRWNFDTRLFALAVPSSRLLSPRGDGIYRWLDVMRKVSDKYSVAR